MPEARLSKAAYEAKGIRLWQIPPRSPDLNPIQKFWSWLRRELRRRDLQDWEAKRPALGRTAYRARLRAVFAREEDTSGRCPLCREPDDSVQTRTEE